jgi:hypothetical protein
MDPGSPAAGSTLVLTSTGLVGAAAVAAAATPAKQPAPPAAITCSPPGVPAPAATPIFGTASLLGFAIQKKANAQRAEQEELLARDVESKHKVAAALQQAYRRKRQLECDINDCSGEIERIKGEQSGFKMQQTVEAANAAMESIENLLHEGEVLKSKDALLVALVPSRTSAPAGGIFETRIETVKAAKMALDVVIASIPEGTKHGEQVLTAACRALHRYYFGDDMSPYFGFTIFQQNLSTRLITSGEYSYLLHTAGRRDSWANAAARLVMAETPAGLVGDVFGLPVAGHLGDSRC